MSERDRIVDQALQWVALREQCKALRSRRAELFCERAESDPFAPGDQELPCWKTYSVVVVGCEPERVPMDASKWCASCLERQKVHEELRRLTASRGARERTLVAAARRHARELAAEDSHS